MRDQRRVHLIALHLLHKLQQPATNQCSHNKPWLFNLLNRFHRSEA